MPEQKQKNRNAAKAPKKRAALSKPKKVSSSSVRSSARNSSARKAVKEFDAISAKIGDSKRAVAGAIFGQEKVVENTLITLLCGGHGLLVGMPGLAKTKLVETIGIVFGLNTKRVQFTPDLMPSDILGSEILDEDSKGKRHFRFLKGPVFAQLLMADEINRASPRTQSALLQAMQEYHITIAATRHDLPAPFHVLATQNPVEQEGTYPLPEAQLDRFLMQINVNYPDSDTERRILLETTGARESAVKTVMKAKDLQKAHLLVRKMPVGESVLEAIISLVRDLRPLGEESGSEKGASAKDASAKDASAKDKNRPARHLSWGPSPRGAQALILAVRARALLHGRLAPCLDDVIALAEPVLKHRMALDFSARAEGITRTAIIGEVTGKLA